MLVPKWENYKIQYCENTQADIQSSLYNCCETHPFCYPILLCCYAYTMALCISFSILVFYYNKTYANQKSALLSVGSHEGDLYHSAAIIVQRWHKLNVVLSSG